MLGAGAGGGEKARFVEKYGREGERAGDERARGGRADGDLAGLVVEEKTEFALAIPDLAQPLGDPARGRDPRGRDGVFALLEEHQLAEDKVQRVALAAHEAERGVHDWSGGGVCVLTPGFVAADVGVALPLPRFAHGGFEQAEVGDGAGEEEVEVEAGAGYGLFVTLLDHGQRGDAAAGPAGLPELRRLVGDPRNAEGVELVRGVPVLGVVFGVQDVPRGGEREHLGQRQGGLGKQRGAVREHPFEQRVHVRTGERMPLELKTDRLTGSKVDGSGVLRMPVSGGLIADAGERIVVAGQRMQKPRGEQQDLGAVAGVVLDDLDADGALVRILRGEQKQRVLSS